MEEEEKELKPRKKAKMIPVRVVSSRVDNALIEFTLDKMLQRATIPASEIQDGKVPEDIIAFGIPYGIAWEYVELSAKSIDLANKLRANGIWTYEDALVHPKELVSALQAVYGVDLAALLKFARENK